MNAMAIIVCAYNQVAAVITELSAVRSDDILLHAWYVQVQSCAAEVDVVPEVPRTASRQRNHANVEYDTAEEYFRRSVIIPLLDSLIQKIWWFPNSGI